MIILRRMSVKKHIPNLITLCNLLCGCLSVVFASQGHLEWAAYLIFIATVFDFGDGLAARALKVQSEVGKQLDSLADMVTFGFAPGFLMFQWMVPFPSLMLKDSALDIDVHDTYFVIGHYGWIGFFAFLIPLFSALRLAKFNVDESQTSEFKGLATPANALFFAGLLLAVFQFYGNGSWNINTEKQFAELHFEEHSSFNTIGYLAGKRFSILLTSLCVLFSFLLVAPIRMFSFKFKNMSWKGNEVRYIFMGIVLFSILGALLINNLFLSVPIIILLYIVTSMVNNLIRKD